MTEQTQEPEWHGRLALVLVKPAHMAVLPIDVLASQRTHHRDSQIMGERDGSLNPARLENFLREDEDQGLVSLGQ